MEKAACRFCEMTAALLRKEVIDDVIYFDDVFLICVSKEPELLKQHFVLVPMRHCASDAELSEVEKQQLKRIEDSLKKNLVGQLGVKEVVIGFDHCSLHFHLHIFEPAPH